MALARMHVRRTDGTLGSGTAFAEMSRRMPGLQHDTDRLTRARYRISMQMLGIICACSDQNLSPKRCGNGIPVNAVRSRMVHIPVEHERGFQRIANADSR